MEFKWFRKGVPDGVGYQEDPSGYGDVYEEFESICLTGNDPKRVELTHAWRPISELMCEARFTQTQVMERARKWFEISRFSEAALMLLVAGNSDAFDPVPAYIQRLPQHLQGELFGHSMDSAELRPFQRRFRQGFRLCWQQLNVREVVPGIPLWIEDDQLARVRETLQTSAAGIEFSEFAARCDYSVRKTLRGTRGDRVARLLACINEVGLTREMLVAELKLGFDI